MGNQLEGRINVKCGRSKKIASSCGPLVKVLTRIENCIQEVAEEGAYALWYHLKNEDEYLSERIQKRLEAAGYKVDSFYEDEIHKFYINWRDANERSNYVKCISSKTNDA